MESEMPDNSVVVNLNQFERSRRALVSPETLSILHGSRDLLIEGATRALTRQTDAMENALLAMAETGMPFSITTTTRPSCPW